MNFSGCVRQFHRVSLDAFQLIFLYMSLCEEMISRLPSYVALAYVTTIRANGSSHPFVRYARRLFHDFDNDNDIQTSEKMLLLW